MLNDDHVIARTKEKFKFTIEKKKKKKKIRVNTYSKKLEKLAVNIMYRLER